MFAWLLIRSYNITSPWFLFFDDSRHYSHSICSISSSTYHAYRISHSEACPGSAYWDIAERHTAQASTRSTPHFRWPYNSNPNWETSACSDKAHSAPVDRSALHHYRIPSGPAAESPSMAKIAIRFFQAPIWREPDHARLPEFPTQNLNNFRWRYASNTISGRILEADSVSSACTFL